MEKSLLSKFTKYVSLNILGMLGISFYILTDTFFIANVLGYYGLASLNLSISVYSVIHGIGLMIGIGGAARFSILISQNKTSKAYIVFSSAIKFGSIVGIILLLIGLFAAKYLALALGADNFTLSYTKIYLTTILSFAPFYILNNIILAFVRNDKNPNLSMLAMLTGSFVNIILDYVFMFPLEMGMFGASLATGFSPIVSIFVLLFHFRDKKLLHILKSKFQSSYILDICRLGLSTFIVEISSAVVLITYNLVILNIKGNIGVAAYGIVANLALVGIAVFNGLAQGSQPLISRFYGLKEFDIVKKIYKYALFTSVLIALLIYFFVLLYSDAIISIFNREENTTVALIAEKGFKIYFLGFFFLGINIITSMFLSAVEKTKFAFFISIARGLVIIIPLVIVFSKLFNMLGVWLAFVITEFFITITILYLTKRVTKLKPFSCVYL